MQNTGKLVTYPNQIGNNRTTSLSNNLICRPWFSFVFDKTEQKKYLNSCWMLRRADGLKRYLKNLITRDISFNEFFRPNSHENVKVENLLLNYLSSKNKKGEIYNVDVHFDQTPTRKSKIQLINIKDRFNLKKINLHFHIDDNDIDRIKNTRYEIARLMGEYKIGRMNINDTESFLKNNILGRSHHTGTIRMADNKYKGCVDKNLKVFDIENLWVCSSAVFPTPSHANPTFTIMTMAKRLADQIKG